MVSQEAVKCNTFHDILAAQPEHEVRGKWKGKRKTSCLGIAFKQKPPQELLRRISLANKHRYIQSERWETQWSLTQSQSTDPTMAQHYTFQMTTLDSTHIRFFFFHSGKLFYKYNILYRKIWPKISAHLFKVERLEVLTRFGRCHLTCDRFVSGKAQYIDTVKGLKRRSKTSAWMNCLQKRVGMFMVPFCQSTKKSLKEGIWFNQRAT